MKKQPPKNELSSYTVAMLQKNEQRMNFISVLAFIFLDAALVIHAVLNYYRQLVWVFLGLPILMFTAVIIYNLATRKKYHPSTKYINFAVIVLSVCIVSVTQRDALLIMFIVPPFFSVFFYNPRYTLITSAVSFVLEQIVMLNTTEFTKQELSQLQISDVPMLISKAFDFSLLCSPSFWKTRIAPMFVLGIVLCVVIYMSINGRLFYSKQAEIIHKKTSIDTELDLAKKIQNGMLDNDFPDNESFSVYADMTPASEVGGDFYDFFMTDETHLAIVIGDVSGHGTAAAMFMTLTKTLIKVYAQSGMTADKVFEHTGRYLFRSNPQKFFVTCWMGIVDLSNGHLSYSNAGHNYPVLLRKGREPEFVVSNPCFVLGRKRLVRYTEQHLRLMPGDRILLYTDGVTESRSPEGEMFGDERLLRILSTGGDADSAGTIRTIRNEIEGFEQGRERFDDETMLALTFRDYLDEVPMESRIFSLNKETFYDVIKYIEEHCRTAGCGDQVIGQISVASSEILANIESYAYTDGGQVEIMTRHRDRRITIVFKDGGRPFNPLNAKVPDVSAPLSERKPGGLGIFIVKKLMTDVSYKYCDGQNMLTIEKEF